MNFPLQLSFKVIALAPQINVSDAGGNTICYVRQKLLKLKESIDVYTDKSRKEKICEIKANKVLDFSATYTFYDTQGNEFGAVARKGMKSLWKAHYDILENGQSDMMIKEEKPWVKVVDGLVGEVPIVGFITGYVLNPSYIISNVQTGEALVRIKKCPSFWESKFIIEKLGNFDATEEMRIVVSTLMMVLLEKSRG